MIITAYEYKVINEIRCERTPRRYEWQAEDDVGQYVASCYHGQRYRPTRGSLRRGIQEQQRGKLQ